jgi:TonB family protein
MRLLISLVMALTLAPRVARADDEKPAAVPINAIDKQMIAGEREIHLPPPVLHAMQDKGLTRAIIAIKLCISSKGEPTSVELIRGSGYAEADQNVIKKVNDWRFTPYTVSGKAVPVCTAVMFNYSIDDVDMLGVYRSILGKWKCNGDVSVEVSRAGPFIAIMYVEKRRQTGILVSYDGMRAEYVSAGTDNFGRAWTARAGAPANGGLSWTGPELVETQTWKEGGLQIHGRIGSDGPKWDLDCKR